MRGLAVCSCGYVAMHKRSRRSSSHNAKLEEHKWHQLFNNPSMWSDNRTNKKNTTDPDFVNIFTWDGLWIDSNTCPKWAQLKLLNFDRDDTPVDVISTVPMLLGELRTCSSSKDIEYGMVIHAHVLRTGYEDDMFISSSLISMYAKCGRIHQAQHIFNDMLHRDTVTWNSIIMGYAETKYEEEAALELFVCMQHQGLEPDPRTFVYVLKACSSLAERCNTKEAWLEKGRSLHRELANKSLDMDVFVMSTLIDMYSKCGSLLEARAVFDQVRSLKDVVSWTLMVTGYVQNGEPDSGLELFYMMQEEGVRPSSASYIAALNACASVGYLEKGKEIQSKLGGEFDEFVGSSLVNMYCKCGRMGEACDVFDKMLKHDVVSWTSMIQGYVENGQGMLAMDFFYRMQEEGCKPNSRTLVSALNACSSLAAGGDDRECILKKGVDIHSQVEELDVYVGTALVDMYAKCGRMAEAVNVFEKMDSHDVVSYTALMSGYVQGEEEDGAESALKLFARMKDEECVPNSATFAAVLKGCAILGALETGRDVYTQACSGEFDKDLVVVSAAIDFYGKCGSMVEAQGVFDTYRAASEDMDMIMWSALMWGYSRQGDTEEVLRIFGEMLEERVKPDGVTFLSLLNACNHAGLVDRGREFFEVMSSGYGIVPSIEHYTCMVDMLGRGNRLDEALDMVRNMPCEANKMLWMTVLDASRKWKNVEVGKVAFDSLIKLEKENAAAYVLIADTLSNT